MPNHALKELETRFAISSSVKAQQKQCFCLKWLGRFGVTRSALCSFALSHCIRAVYARECPRLR
ncbi:hypothetical protein CJI54_02090 [Bifidobacteriaceae bacterium NR026]|nr:hypothetical protein CJI54_02090 [Bifidobacteriaceae bacterium NR026]